MLVPMILNWNHRLLTRLNILDPGTINPWEYLLYPCNRLPNGLYTKGLGDITFVAHHIIFWSL